MMPVLLIFLFAYMFSQFYRTFLAVVTSELTRDLGLGPAELGNLSAIWFIAFSLSQFLVGYLLDRHGPRRTISYMMLAAVLGAVLFAQSWNYASALTGMGLIGMGCAPVLMGALYYFGRLTTADKFPVYTSILVGFGNLGNLAGARPLAQAVVSFGWRDSMMAIAGLTTLSAVLVFSCIIDPPPAEQTGAARQNAFVELWQIISFKPLWPIFLLNFVSYSVIAAERSLWIGPFLEQVHGFDALSRGDAAFLMGVGMAIGALAVGWLVPLFGSTKRVAIFGNLGTAFAFMALGALPAMGASAAVTLLGLAGLFGMCYGVILSHARMFYPAHLLGRGVTFVNFLSIGGAGLMLSASGLFVRGATGQGRPPAETFSSLHLTFAGILLASLLVYMTSKSKPDRMVGEARIRDCG